MTETFGREFATDFIVPHEITQSSNPAIQHLVTLPKRLA